MFIDLHTHILAGVDDGPEHEEQMYGLLQALYADGVAEIQVIATPLIPHPQSSGGGSD